MVRSPCRAHTSWLPCLMQFTLRTYAGQYITLQSKLTPTPESAVPKTVLEHIIIPARARVTRKVHRLASVFVKLFVILFICGPLPSVTFTHRRGVSVSMRSTPQPQVGNIET